MLMFFIYFATYIQCTYNESSKLFKWQPGTTDFELQKISCQRLTRLIVPTVSTPSSVTTAGATATSSKSSKTETPPPKAEAAAVR